MTPTTPWLTHTIYSYEIPFIQVKIILYRGYLEWVFADQLILFNIAFWQHPARSLVPSRVIGIDHDTVCAGMVGTAIRHSTSCATTAACGRHNECYARLQYQPRQCRWYKWSISILPRSQFYKKQGKLAFSTSCTAVRPHRRLCNDAWRRDSLWHHNWYVTS